MQQPKASQPRVRPSLSQRSAGFIDYVERWNATLPDRRLAEVIDDAGGPQHVAIVMVDLIEGFTRQGALSSPRVKAIVGAARALMTRAYDLGVRHFVSMQDAHPADSPEFGSWPAHCVEGTEEAKLDRDLASLPFADRILVFPKTSIDSAIGTHFGEWLDAYDLRRVVVIGDCTDLCVYQAAMYLRLRANVAVNANFEVIVPASCVATYDLPVPVAQELGVKPHDGDLMGSMFLYQMGLNGVQVLSRLD